MMVNLKLARLPALQYSTWSKSPLDSLSTKPMMPSHVAARLWTAVFFATAATAGIIAQFLLFGFPIARSDQIIIPNNGPAEYHYTPDTFNDDCGFSNVLHQYVRPGLGNAVFPAEDSWTFDRVKAMVNGTKGYSVRDWPLTLGWNNLRYIIEAALLHSQMLNRTLVLPSFVYARSCEFEQPVCAAYATQLRRGDEIGMGDFGYLPEEQQQAWRLPIQLMIDVPRLRELHPVITVAEYLRLHNIPVSQERGNGHWDRERYHATNPAPSLEVFFQANYEPSNIVRVDRAQYQPLRSHAFEKGRIFLALKEELEDAKAIDLDRAKEVLTEKKLAEWSDDLELQILLRDNGWTILHTFQGVWMEMLKTVTEPVAQVAMMSQLRGILDDFEHSNADVLLTEGEVHSNMKPGSLRFNTAKARTDFAAMVLTGVRPIAPIRELGERLARKMQALNDGRQFMSAHMRRGDFVAFSWAPDNTVEGHLARVKARLMKGLKLVQEISASTAPRRTVDVPGITADKFFEGAPPPRETDKFFIATDERDPEGLEYMRTQGAVFISDLLTPEERRIVGWPLLLTDVLSQVEQQVAAHGVFFHGHAMSSVAGGIANLRGARGHDPRTTVID